MKKTAIVLSLLISISSSFSYSSINNQSPDRQKIGYSFGYLMGKSNSNAIEDLDLDSFMSGFKQGFEGQDSNLSNEEMLNVLTQYKKKVEAEELIAFQNHAAKNLKEGLNFLEQNKTKANMQVTQSGLQYLVLQQGTGKVPNLNSKVKVHYEGRLIDGTVFDSSIARDEPIILPVASVIKGWQEALSLMNEGSTYRIFIPAKLAYGEIGSGDHIPPNSTLIFDIQLIDIES